MLKIAAACLISTCFIPHCWADATIYQLPEVDASAKPPLSYQQSSSVGNQIVISASQIQRAGVTNLAQLLNNTAGVQYIAGLGSEPQILIHSEPALIMVDGEAMTNFSMSEPDIGLIPLSEIKEIIISPGVAGAEYGNQSLGGVINIVTQSAFKPEKKISVSLGSALMSQESVILSGPLSQENAYRINAQNEYDQGYRESSQQSTNQLGFKLEHDSQNGSLHLSLYGLNQNSHYPGYLTDAQIAQSATQSIASQGQGDEESNTGLAELAWTKNINNNWQSKTNLSYRQQVAQSNLEGIFDQNYQTVVINPELDGAIGKLQTKAGISLSNETYNYTSPTLYSNIQDANQQQYSGYGSLVFPLPKQISLSANGRLLAIDTHAQFFNNAAYQFNQPSDQTQNMGLLSLNLSKQFNAHTQGYIRRAMGYQLPFIDESNYTANPNTGFGLKATTSTAYETGVNWHHGQWQSDAEVFLINLNNEIGYFTPPNGIAANYNLPSTRREGMSLDAQYEPTLKWTLRVSGTLMSNRFREGSDSGNVIPGASEILSNFSASYQISQIWSIYGESLYTGSQYAEGDNANISQAVPSYWLFNLALNAEFPEWMFSFRVDNLANTQYNLAAVYDQFIAATPNNNIAYYPAPGRTAMLQISYRLS
ncbi:MAG: btuB [Gammaproteobacteria bacterium]|jgi:iron complex outermembrane receptor protein|nr:btuB [Gammaproteobacteria bacterium]